MTRLAHHLVVALGALVLALLLSVAGVGLYQALAAEPLTCSFTPTSPTLDTFQQVAPGSKWNSDMHNLLLCAVNALERRSKLNGVHESVCTSVAVPASTRQLVPIGLASSVTGTEPAFANVIDSTNPSRVSADGIQGLSGSTVTVAVFNHDAANARTVRVCASVVRS